MVTFRAFEKGDYRAVCDFLVELNRDGQRHINWNWARFEWMFVHPEFDRESAHTIGLWWDEGRIVGAAIYDMYFGEALAAALPGYPAVESAALDYAANVLRDENGMAVAVEDTDTQAITAALRLGYVPTDREENMLRIDLLKPLAFTLEAGWAFHELDPVEEPEAFRWALWQGFDHGDDRAQFLREDDSRTQNRPGLKRELSLTLRSPEGTDGAYCCVWYDERTDYAYVEPVCVIPGCRGRGFGRAVLSEALNRAAKLGAKAAFVLSDMDFYRRLGFRQDRHYTFYERRADNDHL